MDLIDKIEKLESEPKKVPTMNIINHNSFGYAIYDNVTCSLVTFAKASAQVIIYGDYEEALEDCAKGQIVIELI